MDKEIYQKLKHVNCKNHYFIHANYDFNKLLFHLIDENKQLEQDIRKLMIPTDIRYEESNIGEKCYKKFVPLRNLNGKGIYPNCNF